MCNNQVFIVWTSNDKEGLETNAVIIHHDLLSGNCLRPTLQRYSYVDRALTKKDSVRGNYFRQIIYKTLLNVGKDKFVGQISFPEGL